MKKTLTMIGLVAAASSLLAQGNIQWYAPGTSVTTNTTPFATGYPSTTGAASGKTGVPSVGQFYEYVLLAATSTTSADYGNPAGPDWTVVDYYNTTTIAYGTNFAIAGFAGGVSGAGGPSGFQSSLTAGTTYEMMVVGWSANLGTWSDVLAAIKGQSLWLGFGYVGYSNVGIIDPTSSPAVAATIFGGSGAQQSRTILYCDVPEPATFALVGLGGLSLLLFRRRQ